MPLFQKFLDAKLEELVGDESREASNPSLRIEVGLKLLLLSVLKECRTHGYVRPPPHSPLARPLTLSCPPRSRPQNHYEKGDSEWIRMMEGKLSHELLDLGRGETGSRFNFLFRSSFALFLDGVCVPVCPPLLPLFLPLFTNFNFPSLHRTRIVTCSQS